MQGARVALSKGFPGEVGCRNPKVLPREAAQIISKQSNFFQFGRSCGNRLANIRKREEFGCAGAALFRAASGVGGSNGRAGGDLWQRNSIWFSSLNAHASVPRSRKSRANEA